MDEENDGNSSLFTAAACPPWELCRGGALINLRMVATSLRVVGNESQIAVYPVRVRD
jgi:hypothetical protein